MQTSGKTKKEILAKLGIEKLNAMQLAAHSAILGYPDVMLLSPTGSGKTLAFLLPIFSEMQLDLPAVQTLIITPSRELTLQIEQVARQMGTGFKINAAYGGRPIAKDRDELETPPALLIGTPGRIADHLGRNTFGTQHLKRLVLDEFDKSLEIGFEAEMRQIVNQLPQLKKRVLTSATEGIAVPDFIGVKKLKRVDFLEQKKENLTLKKIESPQKDKLKTLAKTLRHLQGSPAVVFCNFKDSIERISTYLKEQGIEHSCFYGGLDQHERERALIKFRNGSHSILLATDLAARGLDVPEIKYIIHYQLPLKSEEFTHRNGRTARMHKKGTVYILVWEGDQLPEFVPPAEKEKFETAPPPHSSSWATLFVSGGRNDKISKGDIAGFFLKVGALNADQLGLIELKPDCAFVAVPDRLSNQLVNKLNNRRLKKRKVRVYKV
jgi:superfamily II DNA/RNA helicase